jgi:S1-C subfamily serine protease
MTRPRSLILACAAFALVSSAIGAAPTESERAALEKQLAEARTRLDAAAGDVARITRELYGDDVLVTRDGHPPRSRGAMLGVNVDNGDAATPQGDGVTLRGVSPGGPADRAGLRAGDVLTAIDGRALKRTAERSAERQLVEYMRSLQPGGTVKVDYQRAGKVASVTVQTVAAEPAIARLLREAHRLPLPEGLQLPDIERFVQFLPGVSGLELVSVTPRLGQYFGTDKGLLVVRVPAESGLPLQEGDILQSIAGRAPENPGHAFRILRSYQPGEQVAIRVLRMRKAVDLEVTVPAAGFGGPPPFARPLPAPPPATIQPQPPPRPPAAPRNDSA